MRRGGGVGRHGKGEEMRGCRKALGGPLQHLPPCCHMLTPCFPPPRRPPPPARCPQAEMKGDTTQQRRWEAYDKLGTFIIYALSFVLAIQAIGLEGEGSGLGLNRGFVSGIAHARHARTDAFPRPSSRPAVTSVLAIGGIGGLAIGLAGREICENLLNGFLIMSTVSPL